MLSLSVRVALMALVAAVVVVGDPSYPYKPCHPHTVTVTKVQTIVKEVSAGYWEGPLCGVIADQVREADPCSQIN